MRIDASIDRLREALAELGFETAAGSESRARWEELDEELAPLALPGDLRLLLQRLDLPRLPLRTYPGPSTLDFALWGWRGYRDGSAGGYPAGLFPWAYEGHNHLLVELDEPGIAGGAIFEWGVGDRELQLRFQRSVDWSETAIALLGEGAFERVEHRGHAWLHADDERWRELAAARLAAAGPHPVYGRQVRFSESEEAWPRHWAEAARIARLDPPPDFPPMTVAEVRAARRERTVRALVTGQVRPMGGRAGEDARIWLHDGTGFLDVLCPVAIRGRASADLMERGDRRVELIADHRTAPLPPVDWHAIARTTARGGHDLGALLAQQPPDAVATIIHPSA